MAQKGPDIYIIKISWWRSAASTGALLLLWFFVFSSVLGYGGA
jgi:hypothetical protein